MNIMHSTRKNGHPDFLWPFVLLAALLLITTTAWGAEPVADHDITNHVESEFLFDPAIPFDTVYVSTDTGIVTLNGSVNNLLAKERAAHIAETVRGVRSVINLIKVDPLVDHSAKSLRNAVSDELLYDPATDSYEISAEANKNGEITLRGTVDSWAERDLAETVTKGVYGVTSVNNSIIVKPETERTDTEIKPEIEKRLHWDTLVDNAMINVRVDQAKVFLSGVVGSAAEKRRATADAWVTGVKAVDSSELKIERWARDEDLRKQKYVKRSDEEIRDAVKEALLYDPRVYLFNLEVEVTEGVVTLRGVVDNIKAIKAARRDALNTVGVIAIRSLIKVRPIARIDDDKIADKVLDALGRNPFTADYDIKVQVKNRVARLNGAVDSYFDKAVAENVAFRAKGVSDVKNSLDVSYPDIVIYDPYTYHWSIYDYPWYGSAIIVTGKSDWEIKQAIETELLWSPFVDSDDVSVSVEEGVATLTGSVDSIRENEAAEQNAFEGGAIAVINKLRIMLINDRVFFGMAQ